MDVRERPRTTLSAALICFAATTFYADGASAAELRHIETIPLGDVAGRIDHFAIDIEHGVLFVAELGNNSVAVVDLDTGTVLNRATGLPHPQGLAYVPATGALFVSTAEDGQVRVFAAETMELQSTIAVGLDPDNVELAPDGARIAVGFLNGLAVLDAKTSELLHSIRLNGHAEGLAFNSDGTLLMANVPTGREIAVVDVVEGRSVANWPTGEYGLNYRIALDPELGTVLAGFRSPEGLGVYRADTGEHLGTLPLCSDVDDLFVDTVRGLVHAICGDGQIMTFQRQSDGPGYSMVGTTPTAPGARTGLFVPSLDRLFVAVPARNGEQASVWVFDTTD